MPKDTTGVKNYVKKEYQPKSWTIKNLDDQTDISFRKGSYDGY